MHAPKLTFQSRAATRRARLLALGVALAGAAAMGNTTCDPRLAALAPRGTAPQNGAGSALFASPQTNPLALSPRGDTLYVANTTSGTLSVLAIDAANPAGLTLVAEIPVGTDPVSVAVRPPAETNPKKAKKEDELVLVANHLSDSVSVVSRKRLEVVQTLQGIDANGVTTTNEPAGVVFADPSTAFLTLEEPHQVLALRFDKKGVARIDDTRIDVAAQSPRALTVAGGKLFVAAFDSGNQTEYPSCAPDDPRGLDQTDTHDEGCEKKMNILESLTPLKLGTIFGFATGPNIGGRVIVDRDLPDRDLFVYDAQTLALQQVVDGVGTLLYGVASHDGSRVWIANTDARNHLDGLAALGNRMFEDRITWVDCNGSCGAPQFVDLDASAQPLSATVPTPYGIAVSGDGATLVVTGSGADGLDPATPGTPAGQPELFGLATLDANGGVLGGVRLGAIPQGVALASDANGAAKTAYVLNTVDATLSVVDVSNPASPTVLGAAQTVGSDPTPPAVKRGRIIFSTARASTSGTFSCESCHPSGNMDELLWVINTVNGPDDGPDPNGHHAEPRTTMPIRGLRDTVPLHWDGTLGDPFGGMNGQVGPNGTVDANCDGANPVTCFRQLTNASLGGVMCAQDQDTSCPVGLATDGQGTPLPGALTDADRNDLAAFLESVSYPPSPQRRSSETLSATALQGASDFFTDEDGAGIGGAGGVGQFVGFAPKTCADNAGGCHSLPLTSNTNSSTVGGFEAPTMRGMWDRFMLFSDGLMSSEESLDLAQRCADGNPPVTDTGLPNDPCSPLSLNPNYPSGADIWNPERGMTPRGSHLATFELIFSIAYGVRGEDMWDFFNEMSVGLPALFGRQVELSKRTAKGKDTAAAVEQLETAATEGGIAASAHAGKLGALHFDPASGRWTSAAKPDKSYTFAALRKIAKQGKTVITFRADLPNGVTAQTGQPLLNIDPAAIAVEKSGDGPAIPRPAPQTPASFTLGYTRVADGAQVLLDGALCGACALELQPGGGFEGKDVLTLSLPGLSEGLHMVQVRNPHGLASNELPVLAKAPE